eukprot:1277882-Rhodomonas_salina.3
MMIRSRRVIHGPARPGGAVAVSSAPPPRVSGLQATGRTGFQVQAPASDGPRPSLPVRVPRARLGESP